MRMGGLQLGRLPAVEVDAVLSRRGDLVGVGLTRVSVRFVSSLRCGGAGLGAVRLPGGCQAVARRSAGG